IREPNRILAPGIELNTTLLVQVVDGVIDEKLAVRLTLHINDAVEVDLHQSGGPQSAQLHTAPFHGNAVLQHIHHHNRNEQDGDTHYKKQLALALALDIDVIGGETEQRQHQPHAEPAAIAPQVLVFHVNRFFLHG